MRADTLHCLQLLGKGIQSFTIKLLVVGFYIYTLYQIEEIPFCSSFSELFYDRIWSVFTVSIHMIILFSFLAYWYGDLHSLISF